MPDPDQPARSRRSDSPTKRRLKDALLALSLANLCYIRPWFGLLFDSDWGYFNKAPVTAVTLLSLASHILLLASASWALMTWGRRCGWPWLSRAGVLGLCVLLLIPLDFVRFMYLSGLSHAIMVFCRSPWGIALGLAVASFIVWQHRRVMRVVTAILVVLLPLLLFSIGKIVLLLLHVVTLTQHSGETALAPLLPNPKIQPRIIWILFDELDYRVGFAERPRGLRLPEFDRLAGEALVAANAYPPADNTRRSMPALTTGLVIADATPRSPSDLSLTFAGSDKITTWQSETNVFARARALGFNTGLAGWYHPYCRVLGASLSACHWYPYPPFEQARGETLGEIWLNQLWSPVSVIQQRRLQVRLYHRLMADALTLATNAQYGLVLLHLPVPHLPGIYRPASQQFTLTSLARVPGYLDNLILTDRTLGTLRQTMEQAGTWTNSWIVISSDHWWRDAALLDGRIDHRVPFILKSPGSSQAAAYAPVFNTVVTHNLMLAILRGELSDITAAGRWLDQRALVAPPVYQNLAPDN